MQDDFGLLIPSDIKDKPNKTSLLQKPIGAPLIFVKRDKFLKIGGFDENFFLYYEDLDLQLRFLKAKEKIFKIEPPEPEFLSTHYWEHGIHLWDTGYDMDEEYDTGDIIKVKYFELHEPPKSTDEMMALSHYFMFELFKETILDIYNGNVSATPQAKFTSEL